MRLTPRPGPVYSRLQYLGFGPFANNFSTLSDVNALIAQIGGNGSVIGFYDRRVGVTSASNNVSAWADCRTVGAGPSLAVSTGTAPTVTSGTSPVTFTSGGASIGNTVSATYNCSGPRSVVFVGSSAAASSTNFITGEETSNPSIALCTSSGGKYGMTTSNADTVIATTISTGATVIVCIGTISGNGAGQTGTAQIPNQAIVSTGSLTNTATNGQMIIGGSSTAGSTGKACIVSAVIDVNFVLSAGQVSTIMSWATTNHAAVAQ